MKNIDIIRAWKDEEYRNGLSQEELAGLPDNPAGMIELADGDLGKVRGAASFTLCTEITRFCNTPCQALSC